MCAFTSSIESVYTNIENLDKALRMVISHREVDFHDDGSETVYYQLTLDALMAFEPFWRNIPFKPSQWSDNVIWVDDNGGIEVMFYPHNIIPWSLVTIWRDS